MTPDPKPAPPGDRLFALIASIPGSGSVDWCDRVRALLDEVRAEAVAPATGPVCKSAEGCYRVVACDPGCAVTAARMYAKLAAAQSAADDQAPAVWIDGHPQLEAIAAAVWEQCGRSDSGACVEDDPRNIAVAALAAVLPAPVDRTDVLREAAETLGRMDYDTDSNDYGYDTYRDAWNGGVMDGADLLRRMADEAQPEPEAHLAERLARVREWVTSDIVDARSGFGSGYREAQRDIRDLLDGRPPTDEAHKERKAQTRIETEATDALARVRAIAERAASNVQRPAARLARRILAELPGQNACPPRCPCHPDRTAAEPPPVHLGGRANAELCPAEPGAPASAAPQPEDTRP